MSLYSREKLSNSTFLMLIVLLAGFSFFLTLALPSVGEEGVYTNITLEMMYNNDYLRPTLYGTDYYRPPLFNWLILEITNIFGPAYVVMAARLVTMLATLTTAGLLIWFVRTIFADTQFALLSAAIYLSGDLLFKRGWLAYADSLFALFVLSALIFLWFALERKQSLWFIAAGLSLCCGFLTKVHTIYLFYAVAGLVLMYKHQNRALLFSPLSWVVHLLAIVFPFAWAIYVKDGNTDIDATANYSLTLLQWPGFFNYITHVLIAYPLNLFLRFLPVSLIAIVMCYKLRSSLKSHYEYQKINIIFWIVLLNLLPYWLAPSSTIRYILPVYPFIALLIAYVVWLAGAASRQLAIQLLIVGVVLKYAFAIWWLPYEHNVYRGNALAVAADILQHAGNDNLYINDSSSAGLRLAVELNKL